MGGCGEERGVQELRKIRPVIYGHVFQINNDIFFCPFILLLVVHSKILTFKFIRGPRIFPPLFSNRRLFGVFFNDISRLTENNARVRSPFRNLAPKMNTGYS